MRLDVCPFCGRDARIETTMIERDWWCAEVRCDGVDDGTCSSRMLCGGSTKREAEATALKAWNVRND